MRNHTRPQRLPHQFGGGTPVTITLAWGRDPERVLPLPLPLPLWEVLQSNTPESSPCSPMCASATHTSLLLIGPYGVMV